MSLLPSLPTSLPTQGLNMFNNAILPYTFTTGELEQLKTKLLSADNQMSAAKQQTGMLSMSISEIRTLLRMIDMTYLQGLSSSQNVLPTISTPDIPQSGNMMNQGQMGGIGGGGGNQRNSNPRQPPPNYLCYNCRVPGHFINDCPQRQQNQNNQQGGPNQNNNNNNGQNQRNKQQKPPPANYICHKCSVGGHWIHECPYNNNNQNNQNNGQAKRPTDYTQPPPANYVCHRCHVPGHWIKNCPTNNDPNFEPHNSRGTPQGGPPQMQQSQGGQQGLTQIGLQQQQPMQQQNNQQNSNQLSMNQPNTKLNGEPRPPSKILTKKNQKQ